MATNQQIIDWLTANPMATDAEITATANAAGVSAAQLAAVTGLPVAAVESRMEAAAPAAQTSAPVTNEPAATAGLLDWKSQIFSSLDTEKTGAPKQLEFNPIEYRESGAGEGAMTVAYGGGLKTEGVEAETLGGGDSEPIITGYLSKTPTTVNGLSVYAHYDPTGKLDYYAAPEATWVDDKTTVRGMWDAEGNPTLNVQQGGGGFVKGLSTDLAGITQSLGPVWTAAKIAMPELALVDVATDVGRSEVNLGTALNAYQGMYGKSPFETGVPVDGATTPSVPTTGTEPLSGIDLGGVGASPNTWMGNGAYGAVPTAISSTVPAGNNEPLSGIDLGGPGASPNTWNGNGTYGTVPTAISSTVPAGSSLTLPQVIKALPLISTVASLVGGGGGVGGGGPTGSTGFDIVPIPDTWKPPTYTGNTGGTGGTGGIGGAGGVGGTGGLDLSKLFTDQNLLIGTQWEGLPNQRNLTFNDIFAAGKQETPMGNPVNLNNLVSAILGQSATSQKSA